MSENSIMVLKISYSSKEVGFFSDSAFDMHVNGIKDLFLAEQICLSPALDCCFDYL